MPGIFPLQSSWIAIMSGYTTIYLITSSIPLWSQCSPSGPEMPFLRMMPSESDFNPLIKLELTLTAKMI